MTSAVGLLEFTDHLGVPLQEGLLLVHNPLVRLKLRHRVKIGCAHKVIVAFDIARNIAPGADWCNFARGFMFDWGRALQAQTCYMGACPTGGATRDPQRQKALFVPDKTERVYRLHQKPLLAVKDMVRAAGLSHPDQTTASRIVRRGAVAPKACAPAALAETAHA